MGEIINSPEGVKSCVPKRVSISCPGRDLHSHVTVQILNETIMKGVGWRHHSLGEEGATCADLMAIGRKLFAALYGQPTGISMTQALYNMCTHKQTYV